MLNPDALNALYERAAVTQYTRELLFSSVVGLMNLVVCRIQPSIHAAYQDPLGPFERGFGLIVGEMGSAHPGHDRAPGATDPLDHVLDVVRPAT